MSEQLHADSVVRWGLGVGPRETIYEAAGRVIGSHNAGVKQPPGAVEAAMAILSTGEVWTRMYAARDAILAARPMLSHDKETGHG